MSKVKVIEYIPHIDIKTGEKLAEPEIIEQVEDINGTKIFGKYDKIKIKSTLFKN